MTDEKESTATGKGIKGAVSEVDASFDEVADELASLKVCDQDAPSSDADCQTDSTKPNNDPDLWKPHSLPEDCPVCFVPLPTDVCTSVYLDCCSRTICNACNAENDRALYITNRKREKKEQPPMEASCAFCRTPVPKNGETSTKRILDRVNNGDPRAMLHLSKLYKAGTDHLPKNESKSVELLQRAVDAGSIEAIGMLGLGLLSGEIGLAQDEKKGLEFILYAVRMGDLMSRHSVGMICRMNDEHAVAIEHLKLSAAAGYAPSMKYLWNY